MFDTNPFDPSTSDPDPERHRVGLPTGLLVTISTGVGIVAFGRAFLSGLFAGAFLQGGILAGLVFILLRTITFRSREEVEAPASEARAMIIGVCIAGAVIGALIAGLFVSQAEHGNARRVLAAMFTGAGWGEALALGLAIPAALIIHLTRRR